MKGYNFPKFLLPDDHLQRLLHDVVSGGMTEQEMCALGADVETLFAISIAENSVPSLKRCLVCAEQLITVSPTHTTLPTFLVECMPSVEDGVLLLVSRTLVSMSTQRR